LNLGAYDVLAKPYDISEVVRVVSTAWITWRHRHAGPPPAESHTGAILTQPAASRVIRGPRN
jgi:hypothetical protein